MGIKEISDTVELITPIGVGEDLLYEIKLHEPTVKELLEENVNFAEITTARGIMKRIKVCSSVPKEYFEQIRMKDITQLHEKIEELGFFQ